MYNKTAPTKTELLQMLAEAVRNTQPQLTRAKEPEAEREARPQKRAAKPTGSKRPTKKRAEAPAKGTQWRR
jgi:hypothetical protein